MTRTIAALTIALLISAGTEAEAQIAPPGPIPILPELLPISAVTEAEARTGDWEVMEYHDAWGDPTGKKAVYQVAWDLLVIGGDSVFVAAAFLEDCIDYEFRTVGVVRQRQERRLQPRKQYFFFQAEIRPTCQNLAACG